MRAGSPPFRRRQRHGLANHQQGGAGERLSNRRPELTQCGQRPALVPSPGWRSPRSAPGSKSALPASTKLRGDRRRRCSRPCRSTTVWLGLARGTGQSRSGALAGLGVAGDEDHRLRQALALGERRAGGGPGGKAAAVIPGTTWQATPAARQASSSSPPRPNTKGSPPLSRTTVKPSRAKATSIRSISSCGVGSVATFA